MPDVTFIVPHKGRSSMLVQTLRSLVEQETTLAWQVCVVTQEPELTRETLAVPAETALKLVQVPTDLTISDMRNLGLAETRSEFVAFLDADVCLSPNWLDVMHRLLTTPPEPAIVSAVQVNSPEAPVLERIRTALSNAKIDTDVDFLPGRNLFMRRQLVEKIGGFPSHLVTCEDYYFTDQARGYGRLFYSAMASYIHLGEDKALWPMFIKEIWRGQSNLRSVQGRRIPWREVPSLIMPMFTPLGLLIILLGTIAGSWVLAGAGLCIAFFPTLVYSARLWTMADKQIPFAEILKFYLLYFPARAYGTLRGLFKPIAH